MSEGSTGRKKMLRLAYYIIREYGPDEMALLSIKGPKVQYTGQPRASTGKAGGRPPIDYQAVEALVDLEAELAKPADQRDYAELSTLTYYLKGVLRL